jgi:hypothetical protein
MMIMKKIVKVNNGLVKLEYQGVSNLEELKVFVNEKADKYRGIVVTQETIKGCEETLEELKPIRTDFKKVRANVNSQMKSLTGTELEKYDSITKILDEVIKPIETGLEVFAEEKRIAKLEAKKTQFAQHIIAVNAELESLPLPLFYELPIVTFSDDWANKSENAITQILLDTAEQIKKDMSAKNDRIDLVKTHCKLLQQEWGLDGDINWLYLKKEIYEDNWKAKLEEMASHQQEQEFQVKEKERVRIEREEEAKRKEIERKHLQEMQVKEKEIEVIKEQVAEVKQVVIPASENKKEFKVRIDCVLSAESFEQIEVFIKSVIITDKIAIKQL